MNARHLAAGAHPNARWGPQWSLPRAHARLTITIAKGRRTESMASESKNGNAFMCPIPIEQYPNVLLAHGGGGKLTHQLIEKMFMPAFGNSMLGARHDGALLSMPSRKIAFTTDSYVIRPLF